MELLDSKGASFCFSTVNLLMLFSVITTNLFALYAFTYLSSSERSILPKRNLPIWRKSFWVYSRAQILCSILFTIPKLGLLSFPISLWKNVSDKILSLNDIGCKNLECLNKKKLKRDCAGCFDLVNGYENKRFVKIKGKNDFVIDDVLVLGSGGIIIGFDINGGSGTFTARMAERNVIVVTVTLNVDAPFSEFIATRGLFPLYLSLNHRFPFYDHVFDLVHTGNGLDVGGRPEKLELLMFDIDRVLRAGGLLCFDCMIYVLALCLKMKSE